MCAHMPSWELGWGDIVFLLLPKPIQNLQSLRCQPPHHGYMDDPHTCREGGNAAFYGWPSAQPETYSFHPVRKNRKRDLGELTAFGTDMLSKKDLPELTEPGLRSEEERVKNPGSSA